MSDAASSGLIVADVGNTRIKWGRCHGGRVVEMAALDHDDEAGWRTQWESWRLASSRAWAISGVRPDQMQKLGEWLGRQGAKPAVIASHRQIPVQVDVDIPDKVGLDRLFHAVAFHSIRSARAAGTLIGAGTAVTVDYVDPDGRFCGGAILPGRRLMARALHDHTAQLPMLQDFHVAAAPGKNTESAMSFGITEAVLGAIERLIRRYQKLAPGPCEVVLTGGDAAALAPLLEIPVHVWPEMTLEGIRLSAEANH